MIVSAATLSSHAGKGGLPFFAGETSYTLTFNPSHNRLTGGANPVTDSGNEIRFSFDGLAADSDNWQQMATPESYFANDDPINGLESIAVEFNGLPERAEISFSYGWDPWRIRRHRSHHDDE